eukprot:TRINITY_DN3974_c0_g1_i1.p1 TRINITY_DN3974_c0_g1~~TRINITY_DN3974_c0_g1_i1.p1  ORF type:complete len:299 (+),score=23.84 TRINITY_DN3974_c0_g1_i1:50-898(+)
MSRKESGRRSWAAGGVAGTVGTAVGYPLDTLKVRVQTGMVGGTDGLVSAAKRVRTDGLLSLWKGVSVPICSRLVIKSTLYSTYGWCNGRWQKKLDRTKLEWYHYGASGAVGGVVGSFTQTPVDFVKVRLQTTPEHLPIYGRIKHVFNTAFPENAYKLPILYRGYPPMLCREVAGFAVYFSIFEYIKQKYNFHGSFHWIFLTGSFVGSVSWTIQYPFDVIKSRMQASKDLSTTSVQVFKDLVRTQGVRGMYRGLSAALLRACFVHGVTMSTYEFILDTLNRAL